VGQAVSAADHGAESRSGNQSRKVALSTTAWLAWHQRDHGSIAGRPTSNFASGARQRLEVLGVAPSQRRQVGTREIEIVEIPIIELAQLLQRSPVADLLSKPRPK
jgi:hypothetical protein